MLRRNFLKTLGSMALASYGVNAIAQPAYPDRPIRWLLGYAVGGGTDTLIRGLAPRVAEILGTTIVIENRPGANGNLASEAAAKATPDGYTFLYNTSSVVVSPSLYSRVNFDPFRDFTAVSLVANIPLALIAHPSVPADNLEDFIEYAKANPEKLTYASAGSGNVTHLANLLFQSETGISAVHIPYQGGGPAIKDVVGGHVDFYMDTVNTALPLIQSGHVKAFAVTGSKRLSTLPDLPTIEEGISRDFEVGSWSGLMAPRGTPDIAIEKMSAAIQEALKEQTIRDQFASSSAEIRGSSSDEYVTFLQSEYDRWKHIIQENNVQIN